MNGDGHPIPLDEISHRLRAHGNKKMLGFRDAERGVARFLSSNSCREASPCQ